MMKRSSWWLKVLLGCLVAWGAGNGCLGCDGDGTPTGAVQGYVYAFADGTGPAPAEGVQVMVQEIGQVASTNASGFYRLDGIPAGSYHLIYSKAGYQTEVRSINILQGRLMPMEDVYLQPVLPGKGNVDGYIYAQGDRLIAVAQPPGPEGTSPVAEATVRTSDGQFSTTTNSEGYFFLQNLPAGRYILEVRKTGYQALHLSVVVEPGRTVRVSQKKKWTLIIFMNADNDLEPFAIQDLNEMEQVGSSEEVNIVVQVDRAPGWDSSNGDWTDCRRYLILRDNDPSTISSPVLQYLGEVDMGDPAVAKGFLQWALREYPAEHYLFDFWNHGSGWRRRGPEADPIRRGVSFDDTSGSHITTTELPGVLDVGVTLDIVAFDASLMQMMEVAYEIRNRCHIVVGSEESPPGEGYPYHIIFRPLVENPNLTPEEWAALIVQRTVEALGSSFDVTQSALRTAGLPNLAAALDQLAEVLLAKGSQDRTAYQRARNNAQRYGFGNASYAEYKDMVDYCEKLAEETQDPDIAGKVNLVKQALQSALIAEAHAGSSVARSHGLSIWVPSPANFLIRYKNLAFAKDTRWDEWISTQGER